MSSKTTSLAGQSAQFVKHCFFHLATNPLHMNKWIVDHVWIDAVEQQHETPSIDDAMLSKLNGVIATDAVLHSCINDLVNPNVKGTCRSKSDLHTHKSDLHV